MLSAKGCTVNFGDMASYYKSSLFLRIAAAFLFALGRHFPMGKWLVVAEYGAATGVLSLIAFVHAGYYALAWYGMRGGCSRVAAVEDAFTSGAHGDLDHTGERSAEGGFSFL